jgi:uncharacterized protein YdeI (YjbR/CyaY-like superfamily)
VSTHAHLPIVYWPIIASYVLIPAAIGSTVGFFAAKRSSWLRKFLRGTSHSPTAWEAFFDSDSAAIVRIKLKTGTWMAGLYAEDGKHIAYASGFPEPQTLLLSQTVLVDPLTGAYLKEGGSPKFEPSGILIEYTEIEYLIIDYEKS